MQRHMTIGYIMAEVGGKDFCFIKIASFQALAQRIKTGNSRPGQGAIINHKCTSINCIYRIQRLGNSAFINKIAVTIYVYIMSRSFSRIRFAVIGIRRMCFKNRNPRLEILHLCIKG